jgi:hypothetical protein
MYNLQTINSLLHAQNILVVSNLISQDIYTCRGVAFSRFPTNAYAKEAGTIEWEFNASQIDPALGGGGLLSSLRNVAQVLTQ